MATTTSTARLGTSFTTISKLGRVINYSEVYFDVAKKVGVIGANQVFNERAFEAPGMGVHRSDLKG